jgi:hypothetical protein
MEDASIIICNFNGQMVKQLENVSGQTALLLRDELKAARISFS